MSSRIEQLIDEIEEYIEGCKPKFMSSTEIIVNKDEIDELLRELRMKTLGNTKTKDCFDNKECNRDSNSSESCGTKHTKKL